MHLLSIALGLGRAPILAVLGAEGLATLRRRAKAELPGLLARLPDTTGHAGARLFLVATCSLVAFHRGLGGRPAAESAALFQAALRHAARWVPRPARRLYRWLFFQPWYHRRLFEGVVGGAGFEGRLVASGPRALSVDYTACGIQLFLRSIGEGELGPHVCALDELESEVFGLGLRRNETLGRGASRCDFRWERDGVAPHPRTQRVAPGTSNR